MVQNPDLQVRVDLAAIQRNAAAIAARCGVDVLAVVKADAYGLGAERIAAALADRVAGFCVFGLEEAIRAQLWQRTGRPILALGPPSTLDPEPYLARHVRPAVSTIEQARALRAAKPVLCLDTGMQRFACAPEDAPAVIEAGGIDEAFTHATRIEHARMLHDALGSRGLRLHAAASSLLDDPEARLDAVRPGLALYAGAIHVSAPIVELHHSRGPAGYSGFQSPRHAIILAGYADGLRPGPCLVNGQRRRILEVGMQTSYIEAGGNDTLGDTVTLLGNGLEPADIARDWNTSPHTVLLSLAGRR